MAQRLLALGHGPGECSVLGQLGLGSAKAVVAGINCRQRVLLGKAGRGAQLERGEIVHLRLRAEAEEAISKIWETAKREKTKAVEDALAQYAEEKAALSGTREKEKADLDAAYQAF